MPTAILFLTALILLLSPRAWPQDKGAAPAPKKDPLATVAGQPIYEEELLPLIAGQLQQIRAQEYEIKNQGLESIVNQKVLEAEAKKQGIAPEKLLEREVDSKVSTPTDAEIESFYAKNQDQLRRPLDEIKSELRDGLKEAKIEEARHDYFQRLWQQAGVSILLAPPKFEIAYDPARVRGDPQAPVTIVEFSDFQCPFCRRSYPVMQELLAKYAGRVKLAYLDFPLRQIHPQAEGAAETARCANEQGKFWEYHDLLFANPGKLDHAGLIEQAHTLHLDETSFGSCLDSGKFQSAVERDFQAGSKASVTGTPAFFINGVLVSGAQPISVFEKAIDAELARIGRQAAKKAD